VRPPHSLGTTIVGWTTGKEKKRKEKEKKRKKNSVFLNR